MKLQDKVEPTFDDRLAHLEDLHKDDNGLIDENEEIESSSETDPIDIVNEINLQIFKNPNLKMPRVLLVDDF